MARLIWSPDSENDLRCLGHFIGVERQSPQAARRLLDAIHEKCKFYAENPELGEKRLDLGPDLRVFGCGTPSNPRNFIAIYRAVAGGIEIVRVFRASQDYPSLF